MTIGPTNLLTNWQIDKLASPLSGFSPRGGVEAQSWIQYSLDNEASERVLLCKSKIRKRGSAECEQGGL